MFGFFYVKSFLTVIQNDIIFVTLSKTIAMKNLLMILLICMFAYSCNSSKKLVDRTTTEDINATAQDTVRIANDELEYEIIIFEPGFSTWVATVAKQRGYYDQPYLETRNRVLVSEWNNRVMQPQRYDTNLYEMQINYNNNIDYGYEVNYMLYNYFVYFQLKYKQRLSSFLPRI